MDHLKRRTVARLSLLTAGLLSGCCRVSPQIDRQSTAALQAPVTLAFNPPDNLSYRKVIDSHGHFFNGSDLQVGGYFSGPLANEWFGLDRYREVYELVRYIGNIIQDMVDMLAPSAIDEWRYLDSLSQPSGLVTPEVLLNKVDADIDIELKRISSDFYSAVQGTDFNDYYQRAIISTGMQSGLVKPEFDADVLYRSMRGDFSALEASAAFRDKQFNFDPRIISAIFSFVGRMFSRRLTNIRSYQKVYTDESKYLKVVAVTDVLVDFDYWLGDCDSARSAMWDQIVLHQRLHEVTNHYTIPIVGFNPWKAVEAGEDYFAMIGEALEHRGFKGAKLYPPIGYFPDGGLGDRGLYRTRHAPPKESELKSAMQRFYTMCSDLNVVVMAHGNHTMGEREVFKDMAGPAAWRRVFTGINADQRVNIGHFGGGFENWMQTFVEQMQTAPNLYGDIGYRTTLLQSDQASAFVKLMRQDLPGARKVVERILYGSDWFMLDMSPDWPDFMESMYGALKRAGATREELDQVFYLNAKHLFKLAV